MAMYEDFDLDITTTGRQEVEPARWTNNSCNLGCYTDCDTCKDCSATCGGMSDRPCDR